MTINRRDVLGLGLASSAALVLGPAAAERYVGDAKLKPGSYVWQPERSPQGPVIIIVSLPEQLVHVYRGGIEIGMSTCSTGKPGHRTPTGIFTILEKQRQHVSSIYKGAQMPNMERLTWGGIALHAGNLPGYPASHGCIRLPLKFSALLFEVTHNGTAVIIADERTQPASMVHPGIFMPKVAEIEAKSVAETVATRKPRQTWSTTVEYPHSSVVISRADGKALVTRDGAISGAYPVRISTPQRPIGTHVYTLVGPASDGSGLLWLAFGLGKKRSENHIVRWQGDAAMKRVSFYDNQQALAVARTFHPGTTLILTDASAPSTTRRTPKDFSVIASDTTG